MPNKLERKVAWAVEAYNEVASNINGIYKLELPMADATGKVTRPSMKSELLQLISKMDSLEKAKDSLHYAQFTADWNKITTQEEAVKLRLNGKLTVHQYGLIVQLFD